VFIDFFSSESVLIDPGQTAILLHRFVRVKS